MALDDLRHRAQVDTLAGRLRHAMAIRGMSADRLDAGLVPPRKKYTAYVANGRRTTPGHDTVRQLAILLDVEHEWLSAGIGPTPTPEDSAAARVAASSAAAPPPWRRDPAWQTERDIAVATRPDAMPIRYIDELGEMSFAADRRPTAALMIEVARAIWMSDLVRQQRSSALPPPGVIPRSADDDTGDEPVTSIRSAHR